MSQINLVSWAIRVMTGFSATAPWASTYPSSAAIMVKIAEEAPLYAGADGVRETLALYLALGIFESGLKQDAEGDCVTPEGKAVASVSGVCPAGSKGHSFCAFQIGESNFKSLEITKKQIMTDFEVCTRAMQKLVRISFAVCRGRPNADERLGHYASGGEGCGGARGQGLLESAHRLRKAKWIFDNKKYQEELE